MPPARVALYVAILASLALLARSFTAGHLPLWLSVTAMCVFVAFTILGMLVPRLEMFADIFSHGPGDEKRIALTFDSGPDPLITPQVLRALDEAGVKATFFVRGRRAKSFPELVQQIHDAGHWLALGPYADERLYAWKPPAQVGEDIKRTQAALEDILPEPCTLLRPPGGRAGARTAKGAKRLGVTLVAWSLAVNSKDSADEAVRRLEQRLGPGDVVRLEDGAAGDHKPPTQEVLPELLELIEAKGLECVSVSQLMGDRD